MTANELSKKFLAWFQSEYPNAKIFRNNAGKFKIDGRWMSFGIPNKGGSDYIAFKKTEFKDSCYGVTLDKQFLIVEFYEIKCLKDKMSKDQIKFADMVTELGGEYYIVHECKIPKNKGLVQTRNCLFDTEFLLNYGFYLEKWNVK